MVPCILVRIPKSTKFPRWRRRQADGCKVRRQRWHTCTVQVQAVFVLYVAQCKQIHQVDYSAMVRTRATSTPCMYCRDTAIASPVALCSVCPAIACLQCFKASLRHAMLTPAAMTVDITCPACRRAALPSFAQLVKTTELQEAVRLHHDDSNYARFWHLVGRAAVPPLEISRFIMCMYLLAAELRMRLLKHAADGIERADVLNRLRPRGNRNALVAAIADASEFVTSRFDDCRPWSLPPQ